MAEGFSPYNNIEEELRERLFMNIQLLTQIYPTTADFNEVFAKDMFIKNNSKAFHQVIYYLFNILNPELTKKKITIWPPYDIRSENKFRNEVLSYINDLNSIYDDANIPLVMTSHLIAPRGFKFLRFIHKLSLLVLVEHLKRKSSVQKELLHPIKPHANPAITKIMLKNLRLKTLSIESDIRREVTEFQIKHNEFTEEAKDIINQLTLLNKKLLDLNKVYEQKRSAFGQEDINLIVSSIKQKLEKLTNNMGFLQKLDDDSKQCSLHLTYLQENNTDLEFKADESNIPTSISHLINIENGKLDLLQFFHGFKVLLEQKNLELPIFKNSQLESLTEKLNGIIEDYAHLNKKLAKQKEELLEISSHAQDFFHRDDETLAVPLNDSGFLLCKNHIYLQ